MGEMKLSMERLNEIGENLDSADGLKKVYNFLYQLTEQLRYWQYNVEPDNLSEQAKEEYDLLVKRARLTLEATEQLTLQVKALDEKVPEELRNNQIVIDQEGIKLVAGILRMLAGLIQIVASDDNSFIRFGGTEENPNFLLGLGGDVQANTGNFKQGLSINGKDITELIAESGARVVVSNTQPAGSGIIWVKPLNAVAPTSSISYQDAGSSGESVMEVSGGAVSFPWFEASRAGSGLGTGGQVQLRARMQLCCVKTAANYTMVRLEAQGKNASSQDETVTVWQGSPGMMYVGSAIRIDETVTVPDITYAGTLRYRVVFANGDAQHVSNLSIMGQPLFGFSTEAATTTAADVEIKYIYGEEAGT